MTQLEARRISYLVVSLGSTGWRFESSPVHQTSFAVPFLLLLNQDCCPYGVHTAEGRLESANPRRLRNISSPPSAAPNSTDPLQAQVRKHLIRSAVCSLLNSQA